VLRVARRAARARDPQRLDPPTGEAEQRRQQRHRGHHRHEHGEDRRQRDALQVGEAHQEQPEQRDDDRRAGHQHRVPGGADRLHDRLVRRLAARHRRAVAGEDQQRVVDADADAEHAGDRGRPVRHVHHRSQKTDERRRDAEPEQRGEERQPRGDQRPEGDHEDERRDQQADRLGRQLALLRGLDDLAAHLDT
jgi:hypothetical protein